MQPNERTDTYEIPRQAGDHLPELVGEAEEVADTARTLLKAQGAEVVSTTYAIDAKRIKLTIRYRPAA